MDENLLARDTQVQTINAYFSGRRGDPSAVEIPETGSRATRSSNDQCSTITNGRLRVDAFAWWEGPYMDPTFRFSDIKAHLQRWNCQRMRPVVGIEREVITKRSRMSASSSD